MNQAKVFALLAVSLAAFGVNAQDKEIRGAGATFPYPAYVAWGKANEAVTGVRLNYQSIGSSAGIKQIQSRAVDFGASDMPLKAAELDAGELVQFPTLIGGAVPFVNLPGVEPGAMKLTGPVLADIFLGKITKWNDPRIVALNKSLPLPATDIGVRTRSDGSGTTFLWTHYLSQVSEEWKKRVGEGSSVSWPVGLAGKGNEGVLQNVKMLPGTIGFAELSYVAKSKLADVQLENRNGQFVRAGKASFAAAASGADWNAENRFAMILTNQPHDGAWPVTGASYVLMPRKAANAKVARNVLTFIHSGYTNVALQASPDWQYVAIPAPVVSRITEMWSKTITGPKGEAVWP
jgi:phosphate transport system substrate-binding protein